MRARCCDAMSIFAKHGPPDLFITFTANPTWPEIVNNLRQDEITSDRPDLVARVFKLKLNVLMDDLTKVGVFGKAKAFVYTIEFQKRGLPHAHILITLRNEDKFTTAERIDQFICAEIPSTESPRLREIVLKCMMHGPCGTENSHAPCMVNGICTKKFPKDFRNATIPIVQGYPVYRRRQIEPVSVRGVLMDNRRVVPYNPFLTLKFNAHINVEVCTSARSIKYLYKYIFKGYDCATVAITANGESELRYNEITNFVNCRYVSAPEAMWRLRESKMHDHSHSVDRLPVHLPNRQTVMFVDGNEEQALIASSSSHTKLEAWFTLNAQDPDAQQYLYTEIPHHYVYSDRKWKKRQRGGEKVVARMYTVCVKDEERFYLRILLLHVPGAQSFSMLKMVNGVEYETFKAAASAKGLLESDNEWENCMKDGSVYLMPRQLRELFAYISCFCHPAQPLKLWQDHLDELTMDYAQTFTEEESINKALNDLDSILMQHGLSCFKLGLPVPTGERQTEENYNIVQEAAEAVELIDKLNPEQLGVFNRIIEAVDNVTIIDRYFFLDGPGGSGKTFLYNALLSFIRGRGQIVLAFATTGISALLIKSGRTGHYLWKLPVPLLETSVSNIRLNSPEAELLRNAVAIIGDESSTLENHALRCIDKICREVKKLPDIPFGGIVMLLGGDFRQTLPIVVRGSRTEILERCIKTNRLWRFFTQLSLTTNMRSINQNEHNKWLLNVGEGNVASDPGIFETDTIQIPEKMCVTDDLTEVIFRNIADMSVEEVSKRVIVAPTNVQILEMNRKIIDKIVGASKIYYSADSIVTEDANDTLNYPIEFLNNETPSGLPPHVLLLKKGSIIMLLRNLNPKKGMCNGTRLIVEELGNNLITAKIISECNKGDTVFIPRIEFAPTETLLPFTMRRRQFPVILAYAITINKSQGQSYDYVGIDLQTPVFSHGQLYVALSRSRNSNNIKIRITPNSQQGKLLNDDRQFTKNVVYQEIFQL